jgi:NAD(P)H-hydrate epimerase
VVILCGQGNNGGDGFVIARHLAVRGYAAVSILCVPQEKLTGDAAVNFEILRRMQLPWFALENEPLETRLSPALASADWIVDALLGTGAKGPPRAPLNRVIELANQQTCRKLAVDIPSGLDCDSGIAAEPTFIANHTCTFVAAKPGLLLPAAAKWVGVLHRLDIGIPHSLLHFHLKEL